MDGGGVTRDHGLACPGPTVSNDLSCSNSGLKLHLALLIIRPRGQEAKRLLVRSAVFAGHQPSPERHHQKGDGSAQA